MNRHPDLEALRKDLNKRLARIEARLDALETHSPKPLPSTSPPTPSLAEDTETPATTSGQQVTSAVSLVGRTLIVLGGGFLLRAITEAGVLSRPAGTAVGLAYALVWFLLADITGGRGNSRSAVFHGLAGVLIGFPLLFEASRTYAFLSPAATIALATALGMVALAVAWRRRLKALAWIASVGLAITLLSLSWGPGALIPAAFAMIVLGLVTLWIGYIRDWFGLVWVTAFLVDVVILMIALLFLADPESEARFGLQPRLVIAVQVFALLGYLGSIVARTLFRNRDVILLEILQTMTLLFLGLGGAVYVARSNDLALVPLGLGSLILAAGCYGVAFTVVDRRVGGRSNFIYYTTLAIVLALISGALFLEKTALSLVFVALALLTQWFGLRYSRVTLAGHSVFYIVAAALWSGLIAAAANALVGSAELSRWTQGPALLVLVAALAIAVTRVSPHRRTWGPLAVAPRVLLFLLVAASVGGLLMVLLNRLLTGDAHDEAVTATIRTVVLAASAVLLAWAGKFERFRIASWLVYPILAVGGLKLLVEDFPNGRPVTLFVSLAAYGGALVLAPRFLRRVSRN